MPAARLFATVTSWSYLRNYIDLIAVNGLLLGTMGSEYQHLYAAKMDSVPYTWSRPGASAMARVDQL